MSISVTCSCGKQLRAKDEYAGKRTKCPACGNLLTIPDSKPMSKGAVSENPKTAVSSDPGELNEGNNLLSQRIDPQDVSDLELSTWKLKADTIESSKPQQIPQRQNVPPPLPRAEWYFTRNGQQYGPVTFIALKQLVSDGKVASTDLIWKAGMVEWQIVSSLGELVTAVVANPTPPRLNTAKPIKPEEVRKAKGSVREIWLILGLGAILGTAMIALLPLVSSSLDVNSEKESSEQIASTFNSTTGTNAPGSEIQNTSEKDAAAAKLKEFAADLHNKLKNKIDGFQMSSSKEGYNVNIKITLDGGYDYDMKESTSLLNPYEAEVYIGFVAEVALVPTGLVGGAIGTTPRISTDQNEPRVIKCEYKNKSWGLVNKNILYSPEEFMKLPKKF